MVPLCQTHGGGSARAVPCNDSYSCDAPGRYHRAHPGLWITWTCPQTTFCTVAGRMNRGSGRVIHTLPYRVLTGYSPVCLFFVQNCVSGAGFGLGWQGVVHNRSASLKSPHRQNVDNPGFRTEGQNRPHSGDGGIAQSTHRFCSARSSQQAGLRGYPQGDDLPKTTTTFKDIEI